MPSSHYPLWLTGFAELSIFFSISSNFHGKQPQYQAKALPSLIQGLNFLKENYFVRPNMSNPKQFN